MDPTNLPLSADARGLAWTSTEHAARVLGLTGGHPPPRPRPARTARS